MLTVAIGVLGLIVGFIIGKFWYSRKINETVEIVKDISKNPTDLTTIKSKIDQITNVWK